ncbi:MAG: sugar phosphate isomerase/epimerase [Actinomycetota bacterium]|nr:sugar phosphate isomerase/epimerase [Actinomycetota bacterium]
MAQLQPRGPFDQTSKDNAPADVFSALSGRYGLTVPHEWWPSAHLVKSFEAAGFSHVQVDSPPMGVLDDARLVTKHAGALRESLGTTGLALLLHAPSGLRLGTPGGDKAMDGLIDYATEAGAEQLIYHALALPDEPASEDGLRYEMTSLRRAVRRAELHGFRIAIENLAPLFPGRESISANPMALRAAAKRLSSEGVGVCLDLGHAHISAQLRRTSIVQFVEPVMDMVSLIHAHDNYGARRDGASPTALGVDPLRLDLHLPPGRGTLPWPDVAPLIMRSTAPIVMEVHPPFRPRVAELHDVGALLFATR